MWAERHYMSNYPKRKGILNSTLSSGAVIKEFAPPQQMKREKLTKPWIMGFTVSYQSHAPNFQKGKSSRKTEAGSQGTESPLPMIHLCSF